MSVADAVSPESESDGCVPASPTPWEQRRKARKEDDMENGGSKVMGNHELERFAHASRLEGPFDKASASEAFYCSGGAVPRPRLVPRSFYPATLSQLRLLGKVLLFAFGPWAGISWKEPARGEWRRR